MMSGVTTSDEGAGLCIGRASSPPSPFCLAEHPSRLMAVEPRRRTPTPKLRLRGLFSASDRRAGGTMNCRGAQCRWSVSTPLVKNSAKSAGGFFKALFLHVVNHNAERSEGPLKKRRRFPNVIGFY